MKILRDSGRLVGRRVATATGVDLGSTAIRAFEISHRSSGPVVENFGTAPVSPGAIQGGTVQDDKAVTAAVRHLWSDRRFRSKRVVLGLTHPQVIVRDLTVPKLDTKELQQALPYLVRDTLPFPADQALLDFHAVGPAPDGGTQGLVVAAPKEAVVDAVHAVERAGLFVESVDLSSFAAMRSVATVQDGAELVIDIGAYSTNLVVHVAGVPRMVRCVPRGGAEITALIALRHDLSIDEAELTKMRIGLSGDPEDPRSDEVVATVGEALRPLFREVRSSAAWFTNHLPDSPITHISLCGGGSLLPGLADVIRRRFDVPVSLADPMARVRSNQRDGGRHAALDRLGSSAAVSIGLTLGAA